MWQYLCMIFLLFILTESTIFKYGRNSQDLEVVYLNRGIIKPHENIKRVSIRIPICLQIKYISLNVQNSVSTPTVTYNKASNTVKVEYKKPRTSASTYEIRVKGESIPPSECGVYQIMTLGGTASTCFYAMDHRTGAEKRFCTNATGDQGAWSQIPGLGSSSAW